MYTLMLEEMQREQLSTLGLSLFHTCQFFLIFIFFYRWTDNNSARPLRQSLLCCWALPAVRVLRVYLTFRFPAFGPRRQENNFFFLSGRQNHTGNLLHGCFTVCCPSCPPRLSRSFTPAVVVTGHLSLAPASLVRFLGKLRSFSHHARGLHALLIF